MTMNISVRAQLMLGAIALAIPAIAQAGEITGTVADVGEVRTLEGAEITIVELGRTAQAEANGRYRFSDVPVGTYTLRARYAGADISEVTVTVAETGTLQQDIALGDPTNEILVLGQTANLFSTISRKRSADGVEDVLTRDSAGQFPDQNVAESLRRLPGINILNDQGEGRFVSVRGLDPELNAASLNGVRLPAPESDVRSVALDVISSDVIESIEVKKSLTPDLDGDTIGASIEIKTTSAFDRKKDLYTGKVEASYADLRGVVTPKASFDFSTKLSDTFGVAGGISYYQRKFSTDNIESDGWNTAGDTVFADTVEYRDYDVDRERISASLSFDYRLSDTTDLYARGIYSQFDDQEYRRRTTIELDEDPSSGTASSAVFDSQDGEITVTRDLKDRFESQKIRSLVLGGKTETGAWSFDYSGSWSKSSERESGSLDPAAFERTFDDGDNVVIAFDYSQPDFTSYNVTSGRGVFLDPGEYEFDKVERTTLSDSQDEEWAVQANLARSVALDSGEFTVKAGGKARWRTKTYDANIDVYEYDGPGDLTLGDADFLGSQSYGLANLEPVLSKLNFRNYFDDNRGLFALDDGDTFESSNDSDYSAKENVYAGYLLGRWDSDAVRVIGGVRVEHTDNELRGQILDLDDQTITPLLFKRNYTDWLPSLTLRYEPVDNLVLRAAGSRSLVRPKLSQLAPRVIVEDDEGETGNPNLRPYKSWNFDLSAEYYFSGNSALTAGFFYKDVKDYVVQQVTEDVTFNGVALDQLTTFVNGDSATIYGFEASFSQVFSFLPSPFDGLLTQLNYTYTDATGTVFEDGDIGAPRTIPLPSSSKNTFNAVLGYEKGPVSLRLAGTYRDKYLDELGDAAEEDRYVADHFQLDFSAKFDVTENVQVFGEWINITDEPYFAYQNFEGRQRLLQYEEYSWTAKGGVKLKF